MKTYLHQVSVRISALAGSTWAFALAVLVILTWIVTGPYFHFSNTWLVTIATLTDVVIFLMVFSIQNTQNRDSKATQLKLNELIAANKEARDTFIGLESLTDEELADLDIEFKKMTSVIDPTHPLHKIHKKIIEEKAARFNLPQHAGHLVDTLLSPFTGGDEQKK
jgi:low affinity Fe/Cu permease